MEMFILYAGIEEGDQKWPDRGSLALQRIAGSNVLCHVINQLRDVQAEKVVLVVDKDGPAISAWIAEAEPGIDIGVIEVAAGATPLQALAACRENFGSGPLLVALGSHIVQGDYETLCESTADLTLFTKPQFAADTPPEDEPQALSQWAGICYFRHAADLRTALDDAPADATVSLESFLNELQKRNLIVDVRPATLCLDAGTSEGLLFANARLLGLGYGSEDAIERSYIEDFTVIPPVFLHESAVIENAVVGPFTNVEAGAKISGSVIRNSLVGGESTVENVVLDGALIGCRAKVHASGAALIVAEGEIVAL